MGLFAPASLRRAPFVATLGPSPRDHRAVWLAVVCVISYTGYDMEDAMIINKMSYERGFGHGSLYLNVTVDLNDFKRRGEPLTFRFGNLQA